MKFCIEVGELKKHQIDYDFNQLLGRLVIKLNQQVVKRSFRLFNEPVTETHLLQVEGERLAVRIKKQRLRVFGSKCLVYVNERLVGCF